jgi:hypothetical protein
VKFKIRSTKLIFSEMSIDASDPIGTCANSSSLTSRGKSIVSFSCPPLNLSLSGFASAKSIPLRGFRLEIDLKTSLDGVRAEVGAGTGLNVCVDVVKHRSCIGVEVPIKTRRNGVHFSAGNDGVV